MMATKYDGRIDKLEERMAAAGKLPLSQRGPHIRWGRPGEEADFSEIEADLLARFGTTEGAIFRTICWGKRIPENL